MATELKAIETRYKGFRSRTAKVVESAYVAARAARFEHGEQPRI